MMDLINIVVDSMHQFLRNVSGASLLPQELRLQHQYKISHCQLGRLAPARNDISTLINTLCFEIPYKTKDRNVDLGHLPDVICDRKRKAPDRVAREGERCPRLKAKNNPIR